LGEKTFHFFPSHGSDQPGSHCRAKGGGEEYGSLSAFLLRIDTAKTKNSHKKLNFSKNIQGKDSRWDKKAPILQDEKSGRI
jgi:hypothetical protein